MVNILPHAHLLGKSWEIYATTFEGDTIPIVKIYHEQIFKNHRAILLTGKDRYGFNNTIKKTDFKPIP